MDIFVFIGNYGSGKTELSVNFALKSAKMNKKTAIVDLDIVNPFFRSADRRELFDEYGIKLIASPFAGSNVDLPIVTAEVQSVFDAGAYDTVVFDVGGDPVGATALGRYHAYFEQNADIVKTYYVVNVHRILSATVEDIEKMFALIQGVSRMRILGLINNSNIGRETTGCSLVEGDAILKRVSADTGVPVSYASGLPEVLAEFEKLCPEHVGELLPIDVYMRISWLEETAEIPPATI